MGSGYEPGVGMRNAIIGYFKRYIAVTVAALFLSAALMSCCTSATERRPEVAYGNVVAGVDLVDTGMSQALFHSQTLAATDEEALAVSFLSGPGGTTPVPSIAQTSSGTVAATSTGFFLSNFQFSPVVNVGAAPIGAGQFGKASPVRTAPFLGKEIMYPEMVVRGNLLGKGDLPTMMSTGFSFPPAQAVIANETVWKLAKNQSDQNAVGLNAIDKGLPVILSAHKFDFVSTPAQISNASIVQRLWRNTHQGSMMDYLYEGDAAYPAWIAPVKNPLKLIDCGEGSDAIKSALNMTHAGKSLSRSFWSL